ncbi:MAG TPA: hypothetical protein VFA39_16495 [Steroidobacteraceae bacterium]|nr:hypothetical protein [Steroidobacteraceae bacterium]
MAIRSVSRAAKAQSGSTMKNLAAIRVRRRKPATGEQMARISAFHKSPAGVALAEAEDSLEKGIAVASVLLEVLEATPGNEHEASVLRIAVEHLEAAATRLDEGGCGASRVVAGMEVLS